MPPRGDKSTSLRQTGATPKHCSEAGDLGQHRRSQDVRCGGGAAYFLTSKVGDLFSPSSSPLNRDYTLLN